MAGIFAFGSNMHLPDLARWMGERGLEAHVPHTVEPAVLDGYALDWHYRSASRDGGAANVVPASGSQVFGVLLPEQEALLAAIDEKEGHPERYSRGDTPLVVRTLREDIDCEAWVYVVTPAYRTDLPVAPRSSYLALMQDAAAAHGLPRAWRAHLDSIPTA